MREFRWSSIFLRVGLAFVFLYAGIASFIEPGAWIGYLPTFVQYAGMLHVFAIVEIGLALWLLSGKFMRYAAIFAALMFAGIIAFNFAAMDVVFRDVALLFMALALAAGE